MRDAQLPRATTLAHVTDAHVAPNGRRSAVLKDRSVEILEDLVDQIAARRADAVLFGGDNIDNKGDGDNDLAEFMRITTRLDRWMCIAGNHEAKQPVPGSGMISKDTFATAVAGHGIGPGKSMFSEVVGDVRVIGIDTTLIGSSGGYVTDKTMDFLARELRAAAEEHVVVLGHHLLARPWAPYRLDVWDAEYMVSNRDAVNSLLASCPRVRAYLCGHHHASRIDRIAGRGGSGGFYHILTPSAAAYPCGARLLTFEKDELIVEMVRPRCANVMEEAEAAVLGGRKARRFSILGSAGSFSDYVGGRRCDNDVRLPNELDATRRIRLPSNLQRAS